MTLLCVPLVSKTVELMVADMAAAKACGADLIEIRLDHLSNFDPRRDLQLLLGDRPLPALVAEDFVRLISEKKPENFKLIISSHNYQNTPSSEELSSLVARIQVAGADIVKIATTAVDIVDVAPMFQVIVHCQVPMIGLVMGEKGLISRLLCPKYGGYLTFGTLGAGKESAPGQPTISDLLNVYNIRQIGTDTKVFGIIGKPVGHSKSPILHNAAFKSVGFNAVYVPFLVDVLADFLNAYSSADFAGFRYSWVLRI
ncbi:hypothetical protein GW17_00005599 [Ensete ventricosum]|nr:hypothetical protein GW17_00005599 [Ensete ventricosum]